MRCLKPNSSLPSLVKSPESFKSTKWYTKPATLSTFSGLVGFISFVCIDKIELFLWDFTDSLLTGNILMSYVGNTEIYAINFA